MAFTVTDFQDLLRLLGEHPEWREALRRQVLSADILELPPLVRRQAEHLEALAARMAELAQAQARTEQRLTSLEQVVERLADAQVQTEQRLTSLEQVVERLADAQVQTEQRLTRLESIVERLADAQVQTEQRLTRLESIVERLADAQVQTEQRLTRLEQVVERLADAQVQTEQRLTRLEQIVEQLADQIAALGRRVDQLTGEVGDMRGRMIEYDYRVKAGAYFAPLARRLRLIDHTVLADMLDDALEAGKLSESERDDILRADIVLSGKRRPTGEDVYVLVEVSGKIAETDVERAVARAAALANLGQPVLPVVAGIMTTANVEDLAAARGVWRVLNGYHQPPLSA